MVCALEVARGFSQWLVVCRSVRLLDEKKSSGKWFRLSVARALSCGSNFNGPGLHPVNWIPHTVRQTHAIGNIRHVMNDIHPTADGRLRKPPKDPVFAVIEPALKVGAVCGK